MKVTGHREVLLALTDAKRDVLAATARGVKETATTVLDHAQKLTSHPYGELPSYLHAKGRTHAKDALATFARRSGKAARLGNLNLFASGIEQDSLPVQFGPDHEKQGQLYNDLEATEPTRSPYGIHAYVGYAGEPPKYVKAVYYGTRGRKTKEGQVGGMIARPFLDAALSRVTKGGTVNSVFAENISSQITSTLNGKK